MKKPIIYILTGLVWLAIVFTAMRYIGGQWEYEGKVSQGLLVGISLVSQQHILYSIATVLASAFIASSVVIFIASLSRNNKSALQKGLLAGSILSLVVIAVAFAWNRKQIAASKLPVAYRYYDSTGRLLDESNLPAPKVRNIILISIDTLNPLRLGVYGNERDTSPVVDSLAMVGTLFKHAFSHSPKTSPAHMSLFTSLYPSVHKIRNWNKLQGGYALDHHLITIAEILEKAGYKTAAFTGGGNVQSSIGFGDGFQEYDNDDGHWKNAFDWLDQNHDSSFFLFLHTFEVHSPYLPPSPFNTLYDPDYRGGIVDSEAGLKEHFKKNYDAGAPFPGSHELFWDNVDKEDSRDVEHLVALYDGSIRFVDEHMINTVMNKLRAYDLVDNTLIIFLSDHGEEFMEHGDFLHKELYDEHIRVPLIISAPDERFRQKVVEDQISLIDVAPTLLDFLGLPIPVMMQGTNMLPVIEGKRLDLPVFSERIVISDVPDMKKAIRTPEWKYIWWPTMKKAELFGLPGDPGEQVNVVTDHPQITEDLHRQVIEWMRENQSKGRSIQTVSQTLDPQTIEKLKSLGYIR